MTFRENIAIGSFANDRTGDSKREAGRKINSNFVKLFLFLGGDSDNLSPNIRFSSSSIIFEGSNPSDGIITEITVENPTVNRLITFPNLSGTVVLNDGQQTLANKSLLSPVFTLPSVNDLSSTHRFNIVTTELSADRNVTLPALSGNDTFVFANQQQTLSNKTLQSATLNSPRVQTGIFDVNNLSMFSFVATASAVNSIQVSNSATSGSPTFSPVGADTNISLRLTSKGNGAIIQNKAGYAASILSVDGAIPTNISYVIGNKSTQLNLSLANGTVEGEIKVISNRGPGTAVITPAAFANGTTLTVLANRAVTLIWDGLSWYVTSNNTNGITIS